MERFSTLRDAQAALTAWAEQRLRGGEDWSAVPIERREGESAEAYEKRRSALAFSPAEIESIRARQLAWLRALTDRDRLGKRFRKIAKRQKAEIAALKRFRKALREVAAFEDEPAAGEAGFALKTLAWQVAQPALARPEFKRKYEVADMPVRQQRRWWLVVEMGNPLPRTNGEGFTLAARFGIPGRKPVVLKQHGPEPAYWQDADGSRHGERVVLDDLVALSVIAGNFPEDRTKSAINAAKRKPKQGEFPSLNDLIEFEKNALRRIIRSLLPAANTPE